MPNVQVDTLTGEALDWAVATCEKYPILRDPMAFKSGPEARYWIWFDMLGGRKEMIGRTYSPSSSWEQAGSILEKLRDYGAFKFAIEGEGTQVTVSSWPEPGAKISAKGVTVLVAAMRCYVKTVRGGEIDLPQVLMDMGELAQ